MKRKSIMFTILATMFTLSACGDSVAKGVEYINPYSDYYSVRYNTDTSPDMVIDFSSRDGASIQNIKKIDMFAPTWNFVSGDTVNYATLEQLKYLPELKSESFRMDMAFGAGGLGDSKEVNKGIIKSDSSWTAVNEFVKTLNSNGTLPYFAMLGVPEFARADGGSYKSYPNMNVYEQFCSDVASYFKEKNQRVIYETWNEPDLDSYTFWTDGMQLFVDMNVAEASAFKKGNPDAYVVEGGLCWPIKFCKDYVSSLEGTLWDYYMKKTEEAGNHIDAFSWHYYGDSSGRVEGCEDESDNFSYWKNSIRAAINQDNEKYDLYTMTQHCTEFATSAYQTSELVACGLIPNIYETIDVAYASTDISRFSWACYFIDSPFSIINPYSWQKTPAFYVLWSVGRLPLAQANVTVDKGIDETFGWRTGVDEHRAGAIVYNKTLNKTYTITEKYIQDAKDSRDISVQLKNVPFDAKSVKVYLIDNEHVAYTTASDKPYLIMNLENEQIKDGDVTIDLKIPGNAACYIEIDDGKGISELDETSNLESHIVRKDYYYEERADLMPYADMYENSFDVSLGMLDNETGKTALMVTLDNMSEFNALQLEYDIFGNFTGENDNKAIGVRVDYHTESGYVNSCDYYWRNYKNGFSYNGWGTGNKANTARSFSNEENGTYTIPLMQNAPDGWNGRVQLTYYMVNAGKNVSAVFSASGVK